MLKKLLSIVLRRLELNENNSKEILNIKYPFSTLIIDETFNYEDALIKEFKSFMLTDYKITLDDVYIIHVSYSNLKIDSSNHTMVSETIIKVTEKNGRYSGLIFLFSDLN